MGSDQKGQLEGLFLVEAGITVRGIVEAQVLLHGSRATADALGDGLAGELEVHTAQVSAMLAVDAQRRRHLGQNARKVSRLDAGGRALRVAAKRSAQPTAVRLARSTPPRVPKTKRDGGRGKERGVGENAPVHRIALPDNDVAAAFDSLNMRAKQAVDGALAVPRDERDLAWLAARIHNVEQAHELLAAHARPDLDANRIL